MKIKTDEIASVIKQEIDRLDGVIKAIDYLGKLRATAATG